MFYLSRNCLWKIAFTPSISGSLSAKKRIRDSALHTSQSYIFQILNIEIITNKHARMIITDNVKRMFVFLDYSEISTLLDPNLPSFSRINNDICMTLLEGTVFSLDEFHYKSISTIRSEFPNLNFEDFILYGIDCVTLERSQEFDNIVFLDDCSILGHVSTPSFVMNGNLKKRKLEFKEKELYTVSRLNNLIRNSFWRIEVLLVIIGNTKEFSIKGSSKMGSCQRFLFRDCSSNIELVAFNELRMSKLIQSLEEVILKKINKFRFENFTSGRKLRSQTQIANYAKHFKCFENELNNSVYE
jgi:hypothetical protein